MKRHPLAVQTGTLLRARTKWRARYNQPGITLIFDAGGEEIPRTLHLVSSPHGDLYKLVHECAITYGTKPPPAKAKQLERFVDSEMVGKLFELAIDRSGERPNIRSIRPLPGEQSGSKLVTKTAPVSL